VCSSCTSPNARVDFPRGVSVLNGHPPAGAVDPAPLVAMLTNYPSDAQRARCLALGADFFWDKSKDLGVIQEAFRALAGDPRGS